VKEVARLARRTWQITAAGLAILMLAGAVLVWPDTALGQMGRRARIRERCEAVLPESQVTPIAIKYRDRFAAAREALVKEERALRALLVADNSTRPALEAQMVKTEAARSAVSRVRLDYLWELRGIIPATNRAAAFRCAQFHLIRRR
jgi:hypothetical protein